MLSIGSYSAWIKWLDDIVPLGPRSAYPSLIYSACVRPVRCLYDHNIVFGCKSMSRQRYPSMRQIIASDGWLTCRSRAASTLNYHGVCSAFATTGFALASSFRSLSSEALANYSLRIHSAWICSVPRTGSTLSTSSTSSTCVHIYALVGPCEGPAFARIRQSPSDTCS
jgi:hypothetical protein